MQAFLLVLSLAVSPQGDVRKNSMVGDIRPHTAFESKILGNKRDVWVYLPPDYDKEPNRRYPVLYMHDGQNVFSGQTSYIPNQEWRADEAAEALIKAKVVEPLIIVAISNAGMARGDEYLPTRRTMRETEVGGKADLYGKFMTDELMPVIDQTYRTKKGPANTGLCGSSFGGVVTMHIGLTLPKVFGKLAVVSPSVWWDDRVLVRSVQALKSKPNQRIWLDMGTDEGSGAVADATQLKDALVGKGWREGKDLLFYIDAGARHNEAAWAGRMDAILLWLFPVKA